jgi:biopolymer transport protein ExbD
MAERQRRRRRSRDIVAADIDVMPLMNLFIVLIPLLLLSAVFIEVSVIDMALPSSAEAADTPEAKALDLEIRIGAADYVVAANGYAAQRVVREAEPGDPHAPSAATRERLNEALGAITAEHPEHHDVRIVAGPTTHYEEIVAVMDVARAAGLSNTALTSANGEAN